MSHVDDSNPLAGHPHIWSPKHPAKTPWLYDWATSKNDRLPKGGLDFYDHDLPDDGFSLGDPLDDINHWELPWAAGRRVLEEPHVVVGDWPGADLSDDETIELIDDDDETDVAEALPPLPSPGPRTKKIQFEIFWSNNPKLLDPRPFTVKIWPEDTQEDIEHGIKMFFNLYSTESTKVLTFIDESGVRFSPIWDSLNHNTCVRVRVWDEMTAKLKKIRDRRRKANGGLKKRGRKMTWRNSGGEKRKRVNGRFA